MPDSNQKFVLNDGTQILTVGMDDGLTVMVRTIYADALPPTITAPQTTDCIVITAITTASCSLVVRNNPNVGDEVLGSDGKTAHVAQVLEEAVLLDNGEMLITGIMPGEANYSSAISDDEKQGLLNELFPPQDDARPPTTAMVMKIPMIPATVNKPANHI